MKTPFRTTLKLPKSTIQLSHQSSVMSVGSCFSEHIGERLSRAKFSVTINPHGILFNPISIADCLTQIINKQRYSERDIFYHNEKWQSFYHHGRFAKANEKACLKDINASIDSAHHTLKSLDFLLMTFGTANVFEYRKTGQIVANCHKVPNAEFERKRLTTQEIVKAFSPILQELKEINPKLKVILTVSPVRHIRDGLIENQRSKSTLLLAIDALANKYAFVDYFPAYELVIDDLRDYRFYNEDMIHPSKVAVDYIWNHFSNTYFSEHTKQLIQEIHKINQAKSHRPFDESSNSYQSFLEQQLTKINSLTAAHSFLNFEEDIKWFRSKLIQ